MVLEVSVQLIDDLSLEDVLVSQQVGHLSLVNWHLLFVCVGHGRLVESPGVLQSKVLVLADLGKFFLHFVGASVINEGFTSCHIVVQLLSLLVLDHVHKDLGFLLRELGNDRHKLSELFLISFVLLVLCACHQVHVLHLVFEGGRDGFILICNALWKVVLEIELGDLVFFIEKGVAVVVVERAIHLCEEIPLLLTELWLWQFSSL